VWFLHQHSTRYPYLHYQVVYPISMVIQRTPYLQIYFKRCVTTLVPTPMNVQMKREASFSIQTGQVVEAKRLQRLTMFKTPIFNILLYAFGVIFTGLGVNLLLYSTFGAGSWDAVNEHMSLILNITLGTASLITNLSILLFIIVMNKSLKYLITLIPIFMIAVSMDFWDLIIFSRFTFTLPLHYTLLFSLGVLVLPFGLSCIIATKFPSMVYDELTFILMKLSNIPNFLFVRWFVEGFAIILAIVLGFIEGIGFGTIHIGSIFIAFVIGPLIKFYLHQLKKITSSK
jgi:uncharacterized protein